MSDDELLEAYKIPDDGPDHPANIAYELLGDAEHSHLRDAEVSISYLFRVEQKDRGGKRILGAVHMPSVQGALSDLFDMLLVRVLGYMPDFLMILDAQWWADASSADRSALVWHELCHIKPAMDKSGAPRTNREGLPVFKLVEHDVAAFKSEVMRYGAWSTDLVEFLEAARGED